jgi:nitroreductase
MRSATGRRGPSESGLPPRATRIPDMGDELGWILSRRSIGKFTSDEIPRAAIEELLLAATHAPNHHLTAPWRFIVLTGDARRTIGAAHARAFLRNRPDAGLDVASRETARLERSPVVIVCVVHTDPADAVRAREDRDAVAAATQNLLLAAHIRGLAAMWRTGAMVDEPEVAEALDIDSGDTIVGFVYLGVPAVAPPERTRPDLAAVVDWRDS